MASQEHRHLGTLNAANHSGPPSWEDTEMPLELVLAVGLVKELIQLGDESQWMNAMEIFESLVSNSSSDSDVLGFLQQLRNIPDPNSALRGLYNASKNNPQNIRSHLGMAVAQLCLQDTSSENSALSLLTRFTEWFGVEVYGSQDGRDFRRFGEISSPLKIYIKEREDGNFTLCEPPVRPEVHECSQSSPQGVSRVPAALGGGETGQPGTHLPRELLTLIDVMASYFLNASKPCAPLTEALGEAALLYPEIKTTEVTRLLQRFESCTHSYPLYFVPHCSINHCVFCLQECITACHEAQNEAICPCGTKMSPNNIEEVRNATTVVARLTQQVPRRNRRLPQPNAAGLKGFTHQQLVSQPVPASRGQLLPPSVEQCVNCQTSCELAEFPLKICHFLCLQCIKSFSKLTSCPACQEDYSPAEIQQLRLLRGELQQDIRPSHSPSVQCNICQKPIVEEYSESGYCDVCFSFRTGVPRCSVCGGIFSSENVPVWRECFHASHERCIAWDCKHCE